MSKTIEGVPEYLTREQYVDFFRTLGIQPEHAVEVRAAHDGVHALVIAVDEAGNRILARDGYQKHRVFIPVRDDESDTRTSRVTEVQG